MFIFNRYDTVYRESAKWSDIGHTRATNWCARHQRSPPQSFLHASHFRQVRGRRDQSQLHYQHSAATCIILTTSLSLNSCWRKSCGLPWQDTRMSQFTDLRSCSSWGCDLLWHALNASMWRARGPRDRWWKRLTDAYVVYQCRRRLFSAVTVMSLTWKRWDSGCRIYVNDKGDCGTPLYRWHNELYKVCQNVREYAAFQTKISYLLGRAIVTIHPRS